MGIIAWLEKNWDTASFSGPNKDLAIVFRNLSELGHRPGVFVGSPVKIAPYRTCMCERMMLQVDRTKPPVLGSLPNAPKGSDKTVRAEFAARRVALADAFAQLRARELQDQKIRQWDVIIPLGIPDWSNLSTQVVLQQAARLWVSGGTNSADMAVHHVVVMLYSAIESLVRFLPEWLGPMTALLQVAATLHSDLRVFRGVTDALVITPGADDMVQKTVAHILSPDTTWDLRRKLDILELVVRRDLHRTKKPVVGVGVGAGTVAAAATAAAAAIPQTATATATATTTTTDTSAAVSGIGIDAVTATVTTPAGTVTTPATATVPVPIPVKNTDTDTDADAAGPLKRRSQRVADAAAKPAAEAATKPATTTVAAAAATATTVPAKQRKRKGNENGASAGASAGTGPAGAGCAGAGCAGAGCAGSAAPTIAVIDATVLFRKVPAALILFMLADDLKHVVQDKVQLDLAHDHDHSGAPPDLFRPTLIRVCDTYNALVASFAAKKGVSTKATRIAQKLVRAQELTILATIAGIPNFTVDHALELFAFIRREKFVDAHAPWAAWGLLPLSPHAAAAARYFRTAKFPFHGKTNCAAFTARVLPQSATAFDIVGFKGVVPSGVQLLETPMQYDFEMHAWDLAGEHSFTPQWIVTFGEELAPVDTPAVFSHGKILEPAGAHGGWIARNIPSTSSKTTPSKTVTTIVRKDTVIIQSDVFSSTIMLPRPIMPCGGPCPVLFVFSNAWVTVSVKDC